MIRKTILVTSMAVFVSGCGGGSSSSGVGKFDGFTTAITEPVAGSALPVDTGPELGAAQGGAVVVDAPLVAESESPVVELPSTTDIAPPELDNPYVESIATSSEDLVNVPTSDTSEISTRADFLFDTARMVRLKVDMADVAGTQGSLSICTDYEETASGYKINYNSCPLRGTVTNGHFEQDLSLMNQFDSAIAVIWFRSQEFVPRYRKFDTADLVQSQGNQEWIWK